MYLGTSEKTLQQVVLLIGIGGTTKQELFQIKGMKSKPFVVQFRPGDHVEVTHQYI